MVQRTYMPSFRVETPQRAYDAIVERGSLARMAEFLPPRAGKIFVVTTEDVWKLHGASLDRAIGRRTRSSLFSRRRTAQAAGRSGSAGRTDDRGRRRPVQRRDRLRRRHRQRRRRIPGGHFHARHSRDSDSHHAARAGGRGGRRKNRRQSGLRKESAGQFSSAARGADRSGRARDTARARVPRRTLRNRSSAA